jgi:hypothetical protein
MCMSRSGAVLCMEDLNLGEMADKVLSIDTGLLLWENPHKYDADSVASLQKDGSMLSTTRHKSENGRCERCQHAYTAGMRFCPNAGTCGIAMTDAAIRNQVAKCLDREEMCWLLYTTLRMSDEEARRFLPRSERTEGQSINRNKKRSVQKAPGGNIWNTVHIKQAETAGYPSHYQRCCHNREWQAGCPSPWACTAS